MEKELKTQIQNARKLLIDLCQASIWERLQIVFQAHPTLEYLHFAKHGEDRRDRYLSVNGLRWEDIDFFIHAYELEFNRRDRQVDLSSITQSVLKKTWPDFKALRIAAEEVYQALADLTAQGIFSTMGDLTFRLVVTKDGAVSYQNLTKEEAQQYPTTHT